ncbi:hypothetical protein [Rhizobium ruizarguesonis]|uniref:hypothetical protein n=1 Tax=Rhizobium ruizarguesonis TaxID=2081791 RepID=UPI001030E587|nr:hypothetical protein [Rhizobium ruizarguesonis]TBE67457.1 hypothetical protein ELH00_16455 [Rhizobium ruizarguesonis]
MTHFKPYPELVVDLTEDGTTRITTKGGEDVCVSVAGRPEDMQRFVDCWNACRKLYAPVAHLEATEARVDKLESLRAEAWSIATALQSEVDQRKAAPGGVPALASTWNSDISSAPRGTHFKRARVVKGKTQETEEFIPDHIWIATKCDKVLKSYFIPPAGKTAGRWSGLADGEQPVAWQAFIVPVHPTFILEDSRAGA